MPPMTSGSTVVIRQNMLLKRAAQAEAAGDAEEDADADRPERLRHQHRDDVARARAERHADAELGRPLAHDPRHHAVDADHRQQDRQRAEGAEERREETAVGHRR